MNRTSATTEKMIERIIKACTALREAVKTQRIDWRRSGLSLGSAHQSPVIHYDENADVTYPHLDC